MARSKRCEILLVLMSESWKYGVYYDLYTFLSLLNFSKLEEVYENRNVFMPKNVKWEKKQITRRSVALLAPSTASQCVKLGGRKSSGSTHLRAPSRAPARSKRSSFRFHLKSSRGPLSITVLIGHLAQCVTTLNSSELHNPFG